MGTGRMSRRAGVAIWVLVVFALIATHKWSAAALVAVVGLLVIGGPRLFRLLRDRRSEAEHRNAQLAYRADQQDRWTARGDSRGVYGADEGVELMRPIEPKRVAQPPAPGQPQIAAVARTPAELTTLLADKPHGWRWALFASVLLQRRTAVEARIRDCQLGYSPAKTARGDTGLQVAAFFTDRMSELLRLAGEVESFMLAPAFMGAFGPRDDEDGADPAAVRHIANRLMDYHDRFLGLAEHCRDYAAPTRYAALSRDVLQMTTMPLEGYRRFIEDLVAVVDHMPEVMLAGPEHVELGAAQLHMDVDDALLERITEEISAAAGT